MLKRELSILTLLVLLCLHGVKAVNLITCGGETASLTCAQGTIKVLSANYGRTNRTTCSTGKPPIQLSNVHCTQSTSLSVLTTQCDGQKNCSIVVGNAAFTVPCFGTYKYLNVSYECIIPPPPPPPPSSTKNLVTCESATASLSCAKGNIKVLSANYGRMDQTTCSTGKPAVQLSNVQCRQSTSLSVLTTQCDGQQNCSIVVGNAAFTDPCPGTFKYLNVSYECILPPPPPPSSTKNLVTCESATASLSCAKGNIKVLSANFGRTDQTTCSTGKPAVQLSNVQCTQNTSLSVLTTQCDGQQNCSIVVGNAAFTDPCLGTYKYVNVSYECILPPPPPPPPSSTKNLVTCESATASLSCAKGNIKVLSANYGRTDQTTCSTGKPANQLKNDRCTQNTSLSVVFSRCDGKQDCSIPATNNVFADPCVGTYKYLNVSYVCAKGKTETICQDTKSSISCEGRRRLNVHFANYGRRDKVTCPKRDPRAMSMCISSETGNLQDRCNGRKRCVLYASNSNFNDRCPRVHKYLEVSYSCDYPM